MAGRVWRKRYFSESSLRSQEIYRPGIGYVWRNYPASLPVYTVQGNSNDRWLLIQWRSLKECNELERKGNVFEPSSLRYSIRNVLKI